MDNLATLRRNRDEARKLALYGPRNLAPPCADAPARWLRAHPDDIAAYNRACRALAQALKEAGHA